jgi:hypothetical protein
VDIVAGRTVSMEEAAAAAVPTSVPEPHTAEHPGRIQPRGPPATYST